MEGHWQFQVGGWGVKSQSIYWGDVNIFQFGSFKPEKKTIVNGTIGIIIG